MIPETARRPDWPRLVKKEQDKQKKTGKATDAAVAALDLRIDALEAPVTVIVFVPSATPASPVEGTTYMDSTTHKLRTYNGTIWNDHW